jgi:hypothetical protein
MIINSFFIPGKVPSMNELLSSKVNTGQNIKVPWLLGKKLKKQNFAWSKYNDIKKEWTNKVLKFKDGLVFADSAYFSYVMFEESMRRDPSNIAASAIKFIEDGLMKAKIIPNDGWQNVLGINSYWVLRKTNPGIHVIMSAQRLNENEALCEARGR